MESAVERAVGLCIESRGQLTAESAYQEMVDYVKDDEKTPSWESVDLGYARACHSLRRDLVLTALAHHTVADPRGQPHIAAKGAEAVSEPEPLNPSVTVGLSVCLWY